VHSLGVGIDGQVVGPDEVLQEFVVGPDHPAGIDEVEVGDGVIDLEDVGFEFARGHDGDVLEFVGWAFEGDDSEFAAAFHRYNVNYSL